MSIVKLPTSILFVLHSFLSSRPATIHNDGWDHFDPGYSDPKEVEINSHWRNFVNTSKSFQELKRELIYLSLGRLKSKEFLNDTIFREFVQKVFLKNPGKQLALHVHDYVPSFTNLGNLHFLMLSDIKNIPVGDFPICSSYKKHSKFKSRIFYFQ
jgi:hypothetical protein